MTTEEKLDQMFYLTQKALRMIQIEEQDLYNEKQIVLDQRNEIERKLKKIAEMFLPSEFYSYGGVSQTQYERLTKILEEKLG